MLKSVSLYLKYTLLLLMFNPTTVGKHQASAVADVDRVTLNNGNVNLRGRPIYTQNIDKHDLQLDAKCKKRQLVQRLRSKNDPRRGV